MSNPFVNLSAKEIEERIPKLEVQMAEVVSNCEAQKRGINNEDSAMLESMSTDLNYLVELQRLNKYKTKSDNSNLQLRSVNDGTIHKPFAEADDKDREHAFRAMLQGAANQPVSSQYRSAAEKLGINYNQNHHSFDFADDSATQTRANTTMTSAADGTYVIGAGTLGTRVQQRLLAYEGIRSVCHKFPTATGDKWTVPYDDDTQMNSDKVDSYTELAETKSSKFTITGVDFYSHDIRAGLFKIPRTYLRDAKFSVLDYASRGIAKRIYRREAHLLALGTGHANDEPMGLITAAQVRGTELAHNATSFTWQQILDVKYEIDTLYHSSPSFRLFTAPKMYANLLKMSVGTGDNSPLYKDSVAGSGRLLFDGNPITLVPQMASTIAPEAKLFIWGDADLFQIREIGSFNINIAKELYMPWDAYGIFATFSMFSNLVDPYGFGALAVAEAP
ncbi:phage major capsid protein [Lacunimicrobium album]